MVGAGEDDERAGAAPPEELLDILLGWADAETRKRDDPAALYEF